MHTLQVTYYRFIDKKSRNATGFYFENFKTQFYKLQLSTGRFNTSYFVIVRMQSNYCAILELLLLRKKIELYLYFQRLQN